MKVVYELTSRKVRQAFRVRHFATQTGEALCGKQTRPPLLALTITDSIGKVTCVACQRKLAKRLEDDPS